MFFLFFSFFPSDKKGLPAVTAAAATVVPAAPPGAFYAEVFEKAILSGL